MRVFIDITKERAKEIIDANRRLKKEYNKLLPYYERGDLDHGFEYGNFFNLENDKQKICIQWLEKSHSACQIVVDSLEEALFRLDEIEQAKGQMNKQDSPIEISTCSI